MKATNQVVLRILSKAQSLTIPIINKKLYLFKNIFYFRLETNSLVVRKI
jgi:hypothetical protein